MAAATTVVRRGLGEPSNALGRRVGIVEVERQEPVRRPLLEDVGPFGGAHDLDAEGPGGVEEGLRAVGRGRQEK